MKRLKDKMTLITICEKCLKEIYRDEMSYLNWEAIKEDGICWKCKETPDLNKKIHREEVHWRNKKRKEILSNKNSSEMDKYWLKRLNEIFKEE